MKKIGFVTPWYGADIPGGAEMALRGLAAHLHDAGVELEILTTCVKEFSNDWNVNYHRKGMAVIEGIKVMRFPVRKRDAAAFNSVNYKLMHNLPISEAEEIIYVKEMVNSPELYDYMERNQEEYALFVFIPYMFGTSYYGAMVCPEKSVLIPCFHNESYIYLNVLKEVYGKIRGMIFHAKPEQELANRIYDLSYVKQEVLGTGVHTEWEANAKDFLIKYKIDFPYIMYAGRKDSGKNVNTLINYFSEYKKRNKNNLKLLLLGGGKIDIPKESRNDIVEVGFIPMQDKYNAYAACTALCQPSKNESFSLVIMECWLCSRPILIHEKCEVTKNFAIEAQGGLYFNDYYEFEECVNYLQRNEDICLEMGKNGKKYVMSNFSWDVIVEKYMNFFKECICE